jgi:hypothetical protein
MCHRERVGALLLTALLAAFLAGALCAPPRSVAATADPPAEAPNAPPGLPAQFDELLSLTRSGDWGPLEWGRSSVLSMRILNNGRKGVPYLRYRFERAAAEEEGFLAGAYLGVHGSDDDHAIVRRELERNPRKRAWLRTLVGDGKALSAALRDGEDWEPAVRFLPTVTGCQRLTRLLIDSEDVLVRRAGLYWGFWVAGPAYWKAVEDRAQNEADPLTRRFAAYLLKTRRSAAPSP